jgi:LacI family transcriptional regulator
LRERLTIYEVARVAGVSIASVSRVLHGQNGVSDETREHVRAVIDRMGYVANGAARGLAGRRVGVLGFVFCDLDEAEAGPDAVASFYSHEVVRGAERSARRVGDAILLAATHSASGRDRVLALATKVDGLAVMAGSLPPADLHRLAERVPVVCFAAGRAPADLDSVCVDNFEGARAATKHLLEHGHDDLAFVAGPSRSPEERARSNGFGRALSDAGAKRTARPQARGDFTERGGLRAVTELLRQRRRPPRALVVGNDQMAVGALRGLANAGLSVPRDVALTGFDDIELARHVQPALTTVRQPMREIGAECTRLLLRRIADPYAERSAVVLPTTLVVRRSCGCEALETG